MEELNISIIKLNEKISLDNKRNYGIDLLRIFSMINVIILHINLCLDINNLKSDNEKFKIIWRLESLSLFAVDCYGLISGIVGYKKYKFSNLIYIWFNSSFYSFCFFLYTCFFNKINLRNMIISFFPIITNNNWYITAYFNLYLFIPFLNFGINNFNKNKYKNIIFFYILFFSFYNIIGHILNFNTNNFNFLNNGYSAQWLIVLYIIGGYLGKYVIINKRNINLKYFIFYLFTYLISGFLSSELYFHLIKINSQINRKTFLIDYLSPTIIIEALSLIMIFSKLSINNKFLIKFISFFTPLNLNITLIHLRLFYEGVIKFGWVNIFNKNFTFIIIYLNGIIVYISCGLIDYLRSILFKFLKIRQFCLFIEDKIPKLIEKLLIYF